MNTAPLSGPLIILKYVVRLGVIRWSLILQKVLIKNKFFMRFFLLSRSDHTPTELDFQYAINLQCFLCKLPQLHELK